MHPRYGTRRIALQHLAKGWFINFNCVYRLWFPAGFKIPSQQHKRLQIVCIAPACHRRLPEHYNPRCSSAFLSERLENVRLVKLLVVMAEFTRARLALDVNRKLK